MFHMYHMLLVLVYLVEVIQSFMQVGMHAQRWFVGDFDGVLENTLWDDVTLGGRRRLGTDEHSEVLVAGVAVLLQLLLQSAQPLGHQMYVLDSKEKRTCGKIMNMVSWCYRNLKRCQG